MSKSACLYTTMVDGLALPVSTVILGVDLTVENLDLTGRNIVGDCSLGTPRQTIWVLDLPLPTTSPPPGAQRIGAYRRWSA